MYFCHYAIAFSHKLPPLSLYCTSALTLAIKNSHNYQYNVTVGTENGSVNLLQDQKSKTHNTL
jgi:hypothetical protein